MAPQDVFGPVDDDPIASGNTDRITYNSISAHHIVISGNEQARMDERRQPLSVMTKLSIVRFSISETSMQLRNAKR
jgi:hypothetical protein